MKTNHLLLFFSFFFIVGCSTEELNNISKYKGIVYDLESNEPFPNLLVAVTDGDNVHASTNTGIDGSFEISINIKDIDNSYYFLFGDETCIKKEVRIPGFSKETDMGIIKVEGPALPTVEWSGQRIDSKVLSINGYVITGGRLDVLERGVCYSKDSHPTIEDNIIKCGGGLGRFSAQINILDLDVSSNYHFRVYAKNAKGANYAGNYSLSTEDGLPEVNRTGSIYSIPSEATSISISGEANGKGYELLEVGVCWDTEGHPSIETNHKSIAGTNLFSFTIDNLTPSTRYYLKLYAKNKNGVAFSPLYEATTKSGAPTANTIEVATSSSLIVCRGSAKDGGVEIMQRGFYISDTNINPSENDIVLDCGKGEGEFIDALYNLEEGTTYWVRAFAKNSITTSFGQVLSAKTKILATFTVTDTNNNPIPNASIWFPDIPKTFPCNENGVLRLNIDMGTQRVRAKATGYTTTASSYITVSKAQKNFTYQLTKST